jgi:hypothetical protein
METGKVRELKIKILAFNFLYLTLGFGILRRPNFTIHDAVSLRERKLSGAAVV